MKFVAYYVHEEANYGTLEQREGSDVENLLPFYCLNGEETCNLLNYGG